MTGFPTSSEVCDNAVSQSISGANQPAHLVSVTVNHKKLIPVDLESVWMFLVFCDQCVVEVLARVKQVRSNVVAAKATRPFGLKFWFDIEYIKPSIALSFISGVKSYEDLQTDALRSYLEMQASDSRAIVTLSTLKQTVKRELLLNIKNRDAISRIRNLFIDYNTPLQQNGLSWLLEKNQMVAVQHVLIALRSAKLRKRLESNLKFLISK